MSERRHRPDINWVQALGGVLAATTSAVLLSTVGVTGTVIGAAIGSVFATVGSSVYAHYLAISRERVAAAARVAARERAIRLRRGRRAGPAGSTSAPEGPDGNAEVDPEPAPAPPRRIEWGELLGRLRWKRISAATASLFVAAMAVILTFELGAGASVSSFTGGSGADGPRTSIPGLGRTGPDRPAPTSTPSESPDSTPTEATTPSEETTTVPPEETTSTPTTEPTTESTTEPTTEPTESRVTESP